VKHEQQVSILKELMSQLDEKRNVNAGVQYRMPTEAYVCEDIARRERETFFQNHPQLIGLTGDLPEPGTWFTIEDFGTPILATRDKDGKFRAFLNACRHRGAKLTKATRGKGARFTCPFHAWTYSASGDLIGVPKQDHFGPVDKKCSSLIALPAEEHLGMLWVHPQPDGELNVAELLGPLNEEFITHDLSDYVYMGENLIEMDLNWKLANDTFGESYHFQVLHRNTLGQLYHGNNLAYEEIGPHHRFVSASKGIDAMRELPEEEWELTNGAFLLYYLFPNIQLNFVAGNVSMIKIYPHPTDPGKSITRIGNYFTQEVIDQTAASQTDSNIKSVDNNNIYDATVLTDDSAVLTLAAISEVFASTVADEDYVMGEQQQVNAKNGLLSHVIFGHNEAALHHYHNTFRAALGMEPLEKIEA